MRCILALTALVVVATPGRSSEPAKAALAVLKANCYRCHGQDGQHEGGLADVLDAAALRDKKLVLPGDSDQSKLLVRMRKGQMPPPDEHPRPTPGDVEALRTWIAAGAADFPTIADAIASPDAVEQHRLILTDLERLDRRARRFQRYFSLVPLARAGLGEPALRTYRVGLAKLLNSLSWHPRIAKLHPIDPGGLLLRVDLRDLLWDAALWNRVVAEYPYGVIEDTGAFRAVAAAAANRLPVVRGDWFLATASRPPLYHELLQLPTTSGELERQLRLDAAVNIQQERVARAGFTGSGVSRNNRLIERHDALHGAYWRTYDFEAVPQNLADRQNLRPDRRNLFAYPLGPGNTDASFQHAGGEIIFHLPNGLLGFMLVDANNRRVDKAPTAIVSDPRRPDRAVEPGLSCTSCHLGGIQPKTDQVRAHVARNPAGFSKTDAALVRALYPPESVMKRLMDEDAERFRRAVEQCGGKVTEADPVAAAALRFESDLDLRTAAAEVGLAAAELRQRLTSEPLTQGLGALRVAGGTVHRAVFQQAFGDLVKDLRLGTLVQPSLVVGGLPDNTGEVDPLEGPSTQTNAAALAPDGRTVLLASADRSVRLIERSSGRELRRFVGHAASVWAVAWSPDGRRALSGSLDGSVRLWDIATGQELRRLDGHDGLVSAVAFLSDGKRAVSAGFDHAVVVWDLDSGRELRRWDGLTSAVHSLAVDAEGRRAAAGGDPAIWLFDLENGTPARQLNGHTQAVTSLAFAADGRRLLTASDDGTARLWDLESGQTTQTVRPGSGSARTAAFVDDATAVLVGDVDGGIWRAAAGSTPVVRHRLPAAAVLLTIAAGQLVAVGRDSTIRAWPLYTDAPRPAPPAPAAERTILPLLRPVASAGLSGTFAGLMLSPNGRWLYARDRTGARLLRLDTESLQVTASVPAPGGTEALTLARDGKALYVAAASGQRGSLHVLDAATLQPRRRIDLSALPADVVAGSGGLAFVSGGGSGWTDLTALDAERGTVVASWGGVWGRSLLALTPDGTRLLTSTQGVSPGRVEALALPTPLTEKPRAVAAPTGAVLGGPTHVAPDGRYLLCATGTVLHLAPGRDDDLKPAAQLEPFLAVAVVPDRATALLLTEDGSLQQIEYPSWRPRATCRLSVAGYAMTLDAAAGRLYVAGVSPQALRDRPGVTGGDIVVFDVRSLLKGQ